MNRYSQIIISAVGFTTLMMASVACNSSDNAANNLDAVNKQGEHAAPAWSVNVKSACSGVTDDSCRGQYGFTVDANGAYRVGPAPGGQFIAGQIAGDKLSSLAAQVKAVQDSSAVSTESCEAADSISANDTLVLTLGKTTHTLLVAEATQNCYEIVNTASVDGLNQAVLDLENAYYPDVFPDACSDSVGLIQQQYAATLACNTDADCAYVNINLGSVDGTQAPSLSILPGQGSFAVFNDTDTGVCSVIKPMVVANGAAALAHSDGIVQMIQSAIQACGTRLYSNDCSGSTFDSSQAPSCVQHSCRANNAQATAATPVAAAINPSAVTMHSRLQ